MGNDFSNSWSAEELRGVGLRENRDFIDVESLLNEIGVRYFHSIFTSLQDG